MPALQLSVYQRGKLEFTHVVTDAVEIGRANDGEPLFEAAPHGGVTRLPIVPATETSFSRSMLRAERAGTGVRVSVGANTHNVMLESGRNVAAGSSTDLKLPVRLVIGDRTLRFEVEEDTRSKIIAMPHATLAPGARREMARPAVQSLTGEAITDDTLSAEALCDWFQEVSSLLSSATTSSDFFEQAAQMLVNLVQLDVGAVLLREGGDWLKSSIYSDGSIEHDEWRPSRTILARLSSEKRPVFELPAGHAESVRDVKAVVAAPILSRDGSIVGALYGDRRRASQGGITTIEVRLVETIACAVAAGVARLKEEQALLKSRVQFEQFFTPELSRHLAADASLLTGRDAEVSVLFADIRKFSQISEALGPHSTVELISDVMDALSECVFAEKGVLVDYVGDELIGMWGAPDAEPDHAARASRAALAMLEELKKVHARWADRLPIDLAVGVGINSGMARVGNTGSKRKFKYGPLGNTVNLASRVQGATKYLGVPLLVTHATHGKLSSDMPSRRLCTVQVVNISEPIDLYEVRASADGSFAELKDGYEQALAMFEHGDQRQSARLLAHLLEAFPNDSPTLLLLGRCVKALTSDETGPPAPWVLPGK
jgi:adenylate cyclase